MSEFLRTKIAAIAAVGGLGAAALIGIDAAPADALVGATAQVDCAPAYGVSINNAPQRFDVNGDPITDVFTIGTHVEVIPSGQSGSIDLGSSALLEDTTVTVVQTSSQANYGNQGTANVVLDCEPPVTTTTTEVTTTTSEVTTSTTEVPTSTSTSTTTSTTEVPTSTSTSTTEVPTSTSTSTTTPRTTTSTTEAGSSTTQQHNTTTTGASHAPTGSAAPANAVSGNANFTG